MKNTPVSRPYGRCSCDREVWSAQWSETRKRVEVDCACGSTQTIRPSATHPAKVLMAASAFALLGGCAANSFGGITLAQLKADAAFACGLEATSERIANAISQNPWVVTVEELARIACGR